MSDNTWTPYALEPMRRTMRRRRLGLGFIVLILLFAGWTTVTKVTAPPPEEGGYDILVNGKEGTVEVKGADRPENKPVTVAVTPGRIVQADPPAVEPPSSNVQRTPPAPTTPKVFAWSKLLTDVGPLLLIGSVLWLVGKTDRRASNQVNFGIYKGAMPLEMHTASHRHLVVTGHHADRSIFGKDRDDYVPREAYVPTKSVPTGVLFELEDREAG